jgi:outer membrane protein OmpA-like peptidoglycan-associated protein
MIDRKKMMLVGLFVFMSAATAYAATNSLPEPDMHRSTTKVDMRDVVHDETTGTIIRSTSGACVRTQWTNGYDLCGTEVATPRLPERSTVTALSREERTVYFGFNQASLSPEMKSRLDTLAAKLKSEQDVKGARIIGYADRIGNPGYNEKLSKRRAENARQYLVARGIINTRVADTRWVGSRSAVTDCPADLKRPELIDCLQGDRRVEVEIDYFPETQASR